VYTLSDPSATSWTDTDVSCGTTYDYRVRATGKPDGTNWCASPWSTTASCFVLCPPEWLRFDNQTAQGGICGTQTTLSWAAVGGADHYLLRLTDKTDRCYILPERATNWGGTLCPNRWQITVDPAVDRQTGRVEVLVFFPIGGISGIISEDLTSRMGKLAGGRGMAMEHGEER